MENTLDTKTDRIGREVYYSYKKGRPFRPNRLL